VDTRPPPTGSRTTPSRQLPQAETKARTPRIHRWIFVKLGDKWADSITGPARYESLTGGPRSPYSLGNLAGPDCERPRKKPLRATIATEWQHEKQRQYASFNHAASSGSVKLLAFACRAPFHGIRLTHCHRSNRHVSLAHFKPTVDSISSDGVFPSDR
jgi:hypothetical protein